MQSTTLDDVFVHYTGGPARRAAGRVGRGQPVHDEARRMHRTWAIIERELRRFRRSPMLIVMSMIFPLVQLVVLGYAFGGNVKHLKLAIVDQDHGVPAVRIRELARRGRRRRAHLRPDRLRRSRAGARRPAQRPRQRRADDPARLLAARARRTTSRASR